MLLVGKPKAASRLGNRLVSSGATWALAAFVVSRVLAMIAGVRFDDQWIPKAWQFIDPELLRSDLLSSVIFSHTQPPLFNLGLGLVLKYSPLPEAFSFQLVFLALGLVLVLSVLALTRALGARRNSAIIATILITCSPATLLYENWFFYTYPTTVLVTVVAVAIERWVRTGRPAWFVAVCATTAMVSLTQSLFHPLWFVAVVGLAWFARPPAAARGLAIAAIAISAGLVLGVVVKNQVVIGEPGMSSWVGMNAFRVTVEQLPPDLRDRMVADGRLSPQSQVRSFSNYADYAVVADPCVPTSDQPVLAESVKSTRYVNFNYECFGPVFREAQRDAVAALRADPGAVARAQVASWQLSFMPTGDYQYLGSNRSALQMYDDLYRSVVLLTVPLPAAVDLPTDLGGFYRDDIPFSLTIVIALVVVVVAAFRSVARWRRDRTNSRAVAMIYIGMTTLLVFVVGNGFEIGENNRFRSAVEPLMLTVLAVGIDRILPRREGSGAPVVD